MTQILFKNINMKDLHTMKVYEEQGGYQSLKKAFAQKPEEIVEAVKASGLRGRGGALPRMCFPVTSVATPMSRNREPVKTGSSCLKTRT